MSILTPSNPHLNPDQRADSETGRDPTSESVPLPSIDGVSPTWRIDEPLADNFPPLQWDVRGEGRLMLPAASVGTVYGYGEFLLSQSLAVSIAVGTLLLGAFEVTRVPVLYVTLEAAARTLACRFEWMLATLRVKSEGLHMVVAAQNIPEVHEFVPSHRSLVRFHRA